MRKVRNFIIGIGAIILTTALSVTIIFAQDKSLDTENSVNNEIEVEDGKLFLYEKMLNSVDNFTTVQGQVKMKLGCSTEEEVAQYKVDLQNCYTWETVRGKDIDIEVIANSDIETVYNNTERGFFRSERLIQEDPVALMPVQNRTKSEGEEKIWYYREDPTALVFAKESIFPQERIFGYLYDFNLWEIVDEEKCNERICWVISGKLVGEYSAKLKVEDYTFWVDKETGCLLKYEGHDQKGTLQEYITTEEIEYNLPIPVTYANEEKYGGYTDWNEEAMKAWNEAQKSDSK